MKKNVSKILLVSTSLLLACGYTVNAESLEQPEDRTGLEKANEFNEETNQTFDFFGYTFQIPEGWEKSDNSSIFTERYYVETGTGTTMFQVLCDSGIEDYEELYENREEIIKSFGESFENFSSKNILEYEVAGTDAVLFDYNGSTSGNEPAVSEESNSDIPLEYDNALKTAKNYLDYTSFSYTGLIEQLEYEGYSSEACTYAVDNCNADWNEQALNSAINYLEYTAFSYSGLISQLEYEGFTYDQATYGADNCGADWNEQASNAAKNYLEYSSFSRQGLLDQLIYEGFTQEQAEYGVTSVGY